MPVAEVPQVPRVAGVDVRRVPLRDKPPNHRTPEKLGPADARMIAVGEPGNPHPIRPPCPGIERASSGQPSRPIPWPRSGYPAPPVLLFPLCPSCLCGELDLRGTPVVDANLNLAVPGL